VFYWTTVCKTVRLYAIGPLSALSCLSCPVCNVGVGLLWPKGWMNQDETWYGGKRRLRRHCVRWDPAPPPKEKGGPAASPHFSAHAYCSQTVAHLSNCWALVL